MLKGVADNFVRLKAFLYMDSLHTTRGVAQERRRREELFKLGEGCMVRDEGAQHGEAPSAAGSGLAS